jgi:hypothetical protein
VGFRGLSGWCTGWAGDEAGTVYASFIGRKTALTAIWAAFQDNEVLKLLRPEPVEGLDRPPLFKRSKIEGTKYHTLRARLPDTGWQHLVLLHIQATVSNLADLDFYVLSESADPPPFGRPFDELRTALRTVLDRFWAQWNHALPLPARPEWVDILWCEGLSAGLITPCPAEAIHCWRVAADAEGWGHIIQEIVRSPAGRSKL